MQHGIDPINTVLKFLKKLQNNIYKRLNRDAFHYVKICYLWTYTYMFSKNMKTFGKCTFG
jgi:hypothetical protein